MSTNYDGAKKMKKLLLSAALVTLIAGCNKEADQTPALGEPAAQAPVAAPAQAPVAKPVPAPEGDKGIDMLSAAGIKLDFPHAVSYDILDVSHAGTPRRRVLLEVLGGDFTVVTNRFGQSLVDAGYTKTSDKNNGGRIDQVYEQAGKPAYYLLMQPVGMGPKLLGKDAVGSIHIMWNTP
jgi:hypothetical protein